MNRLPKIKLRRLLLTLGLTFVIADTYPHPDLGPGLIQSTVSTVTQTGKSAAKAVLADRSKGSESSSGLTQAKSRYYRDEL